MKALRALLVLLLSLSVPYAALANALASPQCRHGGAAVAAAALDAPSEHGVHAGAVMSMVRGVPHDHAAMLAAALQTTTAPVADTMPAMHAHHRHALERGLSRAAAQHAGQTPCDCALKCSCQHDCTAGSAVLATSPFSTPVFDVQRSVDNDFLSAFVPSTPGTTLLRPPATTGDLADDLAHDVA